MVAAACCRVSSPTCRTISSVARWASTRRKFLGGLGGQMTDQARQQQGVAQAGQQLGQMGQQQYAQEMATDQRCAMADAATGGTAKTDQSIRTS